MADKEEKTEKATPHKRQEVRKKGQIVYSNEVATVFVLSLSFLSLWAGRHYFLDNMKRMMVYSLQDVLSHPFSTRYLSYLTLSMAKIFFFITVPFLISFFIFAFIIGYIQAGGFLITPKALEFKWDAFNPISNIKKFLSLQSLIELIKAILKILFIGWITYITIKKDIFHLVYLSQQNIDFSLEWLSMLFMKLFLKLVWIFIILAALDWGFQKWKFEQDIKMTKEEVKEEFKQREGDPRVKSRIRSMQFEILRKRMFEAVESADVVITNPTHFAVALKYNSQKDPAPIVVAKGIDFLAQKIKKIARHKNIPIVENKPLARFLYYKVKLGFAIPVEVFEVVAKIYAYVYKIKDKKV